MKIKFSDSFFTFPIRVYQKEEVEMVDQLISSEPIDYAKGKASIADIMDIIGIQDFYPLGVSIKDVKAEGFDCTIIDTKDARYICDWGYDKVILKLDLHADKMASLEAQHIKEQNDNSNKDN